MLSFLRFACDLKKSGNFAILLSVERGLKLFGFIKGKGDGTESKNRTLHFKIIFKMLQK
jgi:hypothetical protein